MAKKKKVNLWIQHLKKITKENKGKNLSFKKIIQIAKKSYKPIKKKE